VGISLHIFHSSVDVPLKIHSIHIQNSEHRRNKVRRKCNTPAHNLPITFYEKNPNIRTLICIGNHDITEAKLPLAFYEKIILNFQYAFHVHPTEFRV
jgi:hypothetical protein